MAKQKFSKETYLKWYEEMLLMRRFEERAGQLYGMQKIKGFCHLYIGQEAVVAGALSVITPDDNMITAYRDHAHALGKGTSARAVMAELFAKATGCSKGKGGSMHLFDASKRFFGGHGIVGGQIPLGAGIAFAEKYKGTKNVTLCYMGDGAIRQGAFHEALNMAMTWKLPVVFIIENNHYAMGTSVQRTSNVTELYKLGEAFNMPSEPVDGMTVETVHDAMQKAVDHCRNGNGPYLLEMHTYRYKGHSMSDPAKYRSKEEVESYKHQDPIDKVHQTILDKKFATKEELEAIEKRVQEIVEDSVKFADESPYPDAEELFIDVYDQHDYPYIKED
ncbi:MAG TPA: pyruvate dehydrogenase (acetyl-transferring) E1 component subunit alpha [Bacteroidia bacterium]|nr:MAG: pyruvate dehydrogenase E1 component subunit alpha [Bacteroidetes bacterium OLB10]MBE7511082.1 pyruvate dehydrogenase (acetyl-transferring) E1 component subunit alpha [Bacteroidia bacterium]MBX3105604.1 pyruvate dehydrogenase (acetyl-transferring) E1 component subunit alpha [Bacteroidota bacterium]MCE7954839.1 pyruvate dehydrogenase (acetyl-transferring) E1 component subunit alpha [Bacteroidetes bacterium CHB6]OQB61002.1 MAG: Acetoin:2,6-dichlorophenolindophenol oxidoreductase subunit al